MRKLQPECPAGGDYITADGMGRFRGMGSVRDVPECRVSLCAALGCFRFPIVVLKV